VIDARSPAEVSSRHRGGGRAGETLTVLGSGTDGSTVCKEVWPSPCGTSISSMSTSRARGAGWCRIDLGSGPDRDCVARSRRGVRIGAECRCRRLRPRGWNRSACQLLGFSSDHVRSFDIVTRRMDSSRFRTRPLRSVLGAPRGEGWIRRRHLRDDRPPAVDPRVRRWGVLRRPDAAEVLRAYADWAPSLPGSSTTSLALLACPPRDALPEAIRGRHVVHVRFASLGPGVEGRARSTTSGPWPGRCSTRSATFPTHSWGRSTVTQENRCPLSTALLFGDARRRHRQCRARSR